MERNKQIEDSFFETLENLTDYTVKQQIYINSFEEDRKIIGFPVPNKKDRFEMNWIDLYLLKQSKKEFESDSCHAIAEEREHTIFERYYFKRMTETQKTVHFDRMRNFLKENNGNSYA